jgi:hypothetical protein
VPGLGAEPVPQLQLTARSLAASLAFALAQLDVRLAPLARDVRGRSALMFTHRHAVQRYEANTAALQGRAAVQLVQNVLCAWKSTGTVTVAAADFLDGPVQACFNGGGVHIDVLAIQAQAGL